MTATVTLTIANGKLEGKEYVFDQPFIGFIGRAKDCEIFLPDEPENQPASRHHCVLDINPPRISVGDFGSLNGTFVNGTRIVGAAAGYPHIEVPLQNGDELRVGHTVFRVAVDCHPLCADCGKSLDASQIGPGDEKNEHRCPACQEKHDLMEVQREVCTM